ncbi:polynucleotide kinase-phosphatase [Gordonia sp. 'Campus']|uniref:polynucleotide kinase-phosphatase n=1 Tax=Gordonia sp. 'Campus' TaxID=2915824 RepID=UPI001EE40CD5|nr:polynucleotide kinase-phosphatase [Gordonia sp. 'Campus']
MSRIEIPSLGLVVLVGVAGAGKSTFARTHFSDTEVLSSDAFRGFVADDPTDQTATADAFEALIDVARRRLRRGLLTVVDATSLRPEDRKVLVDLAKDEDVFAVAIVLDVPVAVLVGRVADREDIDEGVVVRQHKLLRQHGKNLRREGFRFVHVLSDQAEIEAAELVRTRLFNDRTDDHGPFDIVGDVHGCADELSDLLTALGWSLVRDADGRAVAARDHPDGRRAIFVGDLVDRGPDTPGVLRLVMSMVSAGQAMCVRGNHEEKLLRVLRERTARGAESTVLTHGLAETIAQLADEPDDFVADVTAFLDGLVSHYVFDDGRLVVAHAGLAERYHGRTSGRVRNLAMYGETTGEKDRWGFPVRVEWARDYRGTAMVVYGHTPVPTAAWLNNTLCVDTGCVFGGRLTALRYPEADIVDVAARTEHWPSERPMGYGDTTGDARVRSTIRLDDVVGKRAVGNRFGPSITVRDDHAAAALEVMSRFAVDAGWLRYLPPTMSPVTGTADGLLEDPEAAFEFYRRSGVARVVCEEKHMGSRAVLVICDGEATATEVFGVTGGVGALYTRTGRSFFGPHDTASIIERAGSAARSVFGSLGCRWMILDAELLPWNIKGEGLIRSEFAGVAAAAGPELDLLASELAVAAGRGLDVTGPVAAAASRRADIDAFTRAYLDHVQVGATVSAARIAPFEVLAFGGPDGSHTAEELPHAWHLDVAGQLRAADPELFVTTAHRDVDLGDDAAVAEAALWWHDLTDAGGEGMVVKPAANMTRDRRGRMVAPGVKVRGREYLRIVYGPSYTDDIGRLRGRDLRHKRSMALREYQLGREALARHIGGEPLWRVHEAVFAVLALESEPVDSRL